MHPENVTHRSADIEDIHVANISDEEFEDLTPEPAQNAETTTQTPLIVRDQHIVMSEYL